MKYQNYQYEQGQEQAGTKKLTDIFNTSLDKLKDDPHLGQDAKQLRNDVKKLVLQGFQLIDMIKGLMQNQKIVHPNLPRKYEYIIR